MSGSDRTVRVPRAINVGIAAVLAIVTGFGLVGLVFADAGLFFPALVVPLGAVAAIALFLAARPRELAPLQRAIDGLPAAGAVLVAIGALVVNLGHSAQHLLIDRDPGAYVNTGRWLASHPGLVFDAKVGPFATVTGLRYDTPALYGHGLSMHFQFSHLLGVLLAEGHWIGGDRLMLAVPAILGALSLVVFYALACRFVRPVLALVATTALAVDVVQLHFTRDAYSEIIVQLVLFGCIWLLGLATETGPGLGNSRALFAGILLGTTVAARLDGPLYVAAVPVLVAIAAARRRAGTTESDDGIEWSAVIRFALAVGAVALLGIADVAIRVPQYAGEAGWRVAAEYGGLVLLSIVAIVLGRRAVLSQARLARARRAPTIAAGAAVVWLFALWFIRPYVEHPRGRAIGLVREIQAAHGLHVDTGQRYYQDAMRWQSWYIGPVALAAGILGFALMLRFTIRRGGFVHWVLIMSFGVVGFVYLWNASITPDQLWAMRRFVPIVLPGFVLFAVVLAEWLLRRHGRVGLVAVAVLGGFMVGWPLSATLPVRAERTQPRMLDAIEATCRALGPHGAVVVLNGKSELYRQVPQALRGFCGVPVAVRTDRFDDAGFAALARQWRAHGRVLSVFADSPQRIAQAVPSAHPRVVARPKNVHLLDQTLDRPPRSYVTRDDTFVVAKVPTR